MKPKFKSLLTISFALIMGLSLQNCASRVVYVRKKPPVKRVEVRPAKPYPGAVWISGYWKWNGRSYVWVSGHWAKPKKGKVWVPGHWSKNNRGWHYVPGHWK